MQLRFCVFPIIIAISACSTKASEPQANLSIDTEIRIALSDSPEKVLVQKSPLRYNKRFALSFHADDGLADVYELGFRYFTGVNSSSTSYSGLYYTDDCGNDVHFKLSAAIFSYNSWNKEDMHRHGNNYNTVSWNQLDTMYRHGCGIYNHGFTSDAPTHLPDIQYSVKRNESYIRRSLANTIPGGVITRVLVNPNGLSEFSPVAFELGYRYTFRMGASQWMPETGIDVNAFEAWDKPLELNRVLAENIDVKKLADRLYEQSKNGSNYWMSVFTHSLIDHYPLDNFLSDWEYIAKTYGKDGHDAIWVASEEEILNYLLIRQKIRLTHELKGKTLIVKLKGSLPANLRFYNLTILVHTPGALVSNMTIKGAKNHTHTTTGKDQMLINLGWEGPKPERFEDLAGQAAALAERSPTLLNAHVAMDYVYALPEGDLKKQLRDKLCALKAIEFEKGFCP